MTRGCGARQVAGLALRVRGGDLSAIPLLSRPVTLCQRPPFLASARRLPLKPEMSSTPSGVGCPKGWRRLAREVHALGRQRQPLVGHRRNEPEALQVAGCDLVVSPFRLNLLQVRRCPLAPGWRGGAITLTTPPPEPRWRRRCHDETVRHPAIGVSQAVGAPCPSPVPRPFQFALRLARVEPSIPQPVRRCRRATLLAFRPAGIQDAIPSGGRLAGQPVTARQLDCPLRSHVTPPCARIAWPPWPPPVGPG